jgi:ketosteroid isomerase-like protein
MRYIQGVFLVLAAALLGAAAQAESIDQHAVAKLDTEFQAAVKANDAQTMGHILHKDMILVLGNGTIHSREEQLQAARNKVSVYEHQEEDAGTQTVRVFGDTAVVTARLWIKGTSGGVPVDLRLWFSDTYVRTPEGWRYFFGQASLRLPDEKPAPAH